MRTWQLDSAHTQIGFSAKHMMLTTVRGTFHDVTGTVVGDPADPTSARGTFQVRAASVDTNFGARDTHLRSPDFFDAETFPTIDFVSTAIVPRGRDTFDVTGDLTIRDVTRPTTFRVVLDGVVPGMQGGLHASLSASATIQRDDWGLNWNVALEQGGWLVSKDIKLELVIALDEVAEVAAAAEADGEGPEASTEAQDRELTPAAS